MKKILLSLMLVSMLLLTLGFASAKTGAIWTTTSDCDSPQDANQYAIGQHIYIHGDNFDSSTYGWTITGLGGSDKSKASCNPNEEIVSGTYTVDSSGEFCFDAYTIADTNCGEYSVDFGKKNDNYRVAMVPEFGLIAGLTTVLGALGVFFFVRKK